MVEVGDKVKFKSGYENLWGYTKDICTVEYVSDNDYDEGIWVGLLEVRDNEFKPYVFEVVEE